MRSKFLKKLLAGVTTLAMAAQLAAVIPASAATSLYTEDFEGKELAELDYSLAGNTTARILTDTAGNATSFFNYYTSGANGDRASTFSLPQAYESETGIRFSIRWYIWVCLF